LLLAVAGGGAGAIPSCLFVRCLRMQPSLRGDPFSHPSGLGSATGPGAESGGSPDSRSTEISSAKKSDERSFPRAAENNRRAAGAPQSVGAKIEAVGNGSVLGIDSAEKA